MRYFAHIQYNGSFFKGWQSQPDVATVQDELEDVLSKVLRSPTPIVGCGRTDTGVHASSYYFHFDTITSLPEGFVRKLNGILPNGIVIQSFISVPDDAHARFDATARSYIYHVTRHRDPFRLDTAYHFPFFDLLDIGLTQSAAQLLLDFEDFFPFCKTNSDVTNYKCQLSKCEWVLSPDRNALSLRLTSNRFLRGMVRLIVGMSLNVGLGKISMTELETAMREQTRLDKALSAPPTGLFLCDVQYPYI